MAQLMRVAAFCRRSKGKTFLWRYCGNFMMMTFCLFKPFWTGLLDKHISKETLLLPTDILHSETELLLPFETGEVLEMLRRILEKQEVNWQMVLSCLATFLVCFQQASASIQGLYHSGRLAQLHPLTGCSEPNKRLAVRKKGDIR
nr:hypothetical protein BaRGS_017842 [Batillaria attramentaria]